VKNLQSFYDVLFGNFVVIILIASGITLFSMFDNLQVTVKEMSTGMIRDRLNLTEEELFNIFDPIVNHLQTTRSRARSGVLKNFQDPELLDAYFLPIIKNSSSISSVLIANDQGDEYMLLNNDSIMITRITKEGSLHERPTVYSWTESNGERLILDQHLLAEDYDPRTRPWFTLAMENPADTVINWTDPYTFFTTRQSGITASIKWQNPNSSLDFVCAVDVLITDLSSFTTSIDITTNGKVFILSEDLQVLGLPRDERFKDKSKWAEFSLKSLNQLEVPVINEAIKTYQSQESGKILSPLVLKMKCGGQALTSSP
jgi:two-component system sensor histidine kinase/response regulator